MGNQNINGNPIIFVINEVTTITRLMGIKFIAKGKAFDEIVNNCFIDVEFNRSY